MLKLSNNVYKSPEEVNDNIAHAPHNKFINSHKYYKKYLYYFIIIIIYKIMLDFSYSNIAEVFDYQGLFLSAKTFWSNLISWTIFFVFCPFFIKFLADKTFSGNIISLLTITSVLPSITVIGYRSDYPYIYIFLMIAFWSIFFITWILTPKIQIKNLMKFQSHLFSYFILFICCFSVILYSYINTGLRLHLSLIDVYDVRAEARGFIAPFPLNYLVSLSDNLLAFFVVYLIYKRHFFMSLIVMSVIFINFSVAGTKQIVFTLVFGIIGYFFIKKLEFSSRFVWAGIGILAMGVAENWVLGENFVNTLFPYRVLFIPAELHYSYYSYFQSNDILFFSQSILKWLYPDIGSENIQFLLGEYSIGQFSARANNGLFSDAYMNLGIVGVLVYPVIIPILLRVFDGSVEGLPERILFVIVVYISFVLLGMTLTSALLTSGLLFMIFFMYSLPRQSVEI